VIVCLIFLSAGETKNREFDWSVLKNASLPILILDERWHGIFKNIEKTREIIEKEEVLKELLRKRPGLLLRKRRFLPVKRAVWTNNKAYAGSV